MGSFNLLDEPWISVISMDGQQLDVSLKEVFSHAQEYQCLAGEMETQNFAVLRFLLAVVQTVFSRFDSEGRPYEGIELDQQMRQINTLDSDDYEDDRDACWNALWKKGFFPEIVNQYLEKWRDHFFLYDDKFPFYQVTQKEMRALLPTGKNPTEMKGRNFNRLISESNNKLALFSPVGDHEEKKLCPKDDMTSAQLARWLIMLQGYIGVADKASLVKEGQKPSKGWLYDIGGLYAEGDNLFETLMLNFIPVHPENKYSPQSPFWEYSGIENINKLIRGETIENLADLYTNWSRAIAIDPAFQEKAEKTLQIVKLPGIVHQDNFIEPMTIWHFNKTGEYKNHFTPQKHRPAQSVWRNFGLIALKSSSDDHQKKPLIIESLNSRSRSIGRRFITICAVSMQDDGGPTSWVPVDEVTDELCVNDMVMSDETDRGWIIRINETVDITKLIADRYWRFLTNIAKIRGMDLKKGGRVFADAGKEDFYQSLNHPFHEWLASIKPEDSKDQRIREWHEMLKEIARDEAQKIVQQATTRDYLGIIDDNNNALNIVTAYQMFIGGVNKILK